jgi:uncharacterized membrane protein required for colicin V production
MAKEKCEDKNPFIGIAAILGGIMFVIVLMFLIFANESLGYAVGIAWGFVILGIFLGLFAYLAQKNKK